MTLPTKSATWFAIGWYRAGHGTLDQSCRQGCVFDGVSVCWQWLVRLRVQSELSRSKP